VLSRLALAALFLAAGACSRKPAGPPAEALAPSIDALLSRALPSVPLIIRYDADGTVGFGSGLIVSDDGLILTNLHVIAAGQRLGVMLYDDARPTYTVLEGGLTRFLFEQQDHILPAAEVARDEGLDLALIRIEQRTHAVQRLPFADQPPTRGEVVYAIGHPAETLWSFSSGVVSALPAEMVQHDALVSPGSSGGPLIDRGGRVVGLNTAMVKSGRGAGYARPAALLKRFVAREASAVGVDTSTVEQAVKTCKRAFELGTAPEECFAPSEPYLSAGVSVDFGRARFRVDMDASFPSEDRAALETLGLSSATVRGVPAVLYFAAVVATQVDSALEPLPKLVRCAEGKLCSGSAAVLPEATVGSLREAIRNRPADALQAGIRAARALIARSERKEQAHLNMVRTACGLSNWRGSEVRRALQRGWRVVAIEHLRDPNEQPIQRAWVLIEGLERSGGRFQFSELWQLREASGLMSSLTASRAGWGEVIPAPADLATLPRDWPPPLYDEQDVATEVTLGIARAYLELAGAPAAPSSTSRR
jgi:hypothetical protein